MNFEELKKDFETTPEEQAIFPRLRDLDMWKVYKNMVERYILKLTFNLVHGREVEEGKRIKELNELSGFIRYWNKIKARVEHKDEDTKN